MSRRRPTVRAAHRRDDAGFTLPELLISIVILSFIAGAIGFSLTVVLRNTRATADRSVSSLGSQLLSTYFPSDVAGARTDGGDTSPAGESGCPDGTDPGTNVLTLHAADATLGAVSYRLRTVGTELQLVRVTCPDGVRIVNVIAQGLRDAADVTVTPASLSPGDGTNPGDELRVVTLGVTVGATSVKVSGTARTPAANAAGPCRLESASPRTLGLVGGALKSATPVHVAVAGTCGALTLTIDRGAAGPVTVPLAGTGADRTATLPTGSGWTEGTFPAIVADGAGFSATYGVWVTSQPCTVTRGSVAQVVYEPLGGTVPYEVTTAGPCNSVSIGVRTGTGPELVAALTVVGGSDNTRWTGTLPTDAAVWTPGRKPVRVLDGGVDVGRLAVDGVPKPCQYVSFATSLPPTLSQAGKLLQDIQLDVTTTGVCGDVRVSIPTGFADPVGTVPLISVDPLQPRRTGNGPLLWSFVLLRCAEDGENESPCRYQQWTDGLKNVTVTQGGDFLATFGLDVIEPCSKIGNSPQFVTLGADGRLAAPTTFTVTTRGRCATISITLPTGTGGDVYIDMAQTGNTHTVTVQPCTARWTAGNGRTVNVFNNAAPFDSWLLDVRPPAANVVVTGPSQIRVSATAPVRVPANTPVTIGGVRDCGQTMTVSFPTGDTPSDLTVPLAPSNGSLVGTITPAAATWRADIVNPKTARVYANGVEVGSFLYVVTDCAVTSGTITISVTGGNRVNSGEVIQFQASGTVCGASMTVELTPPGGAGVLRVTATRTSGTTYRTGDLGNTVWTRGQDAVAAVYNTTNLANLNASTLAGSFTVRGR